MLAAFSARFSKRPRRSGAPAPGRIASADSTQTVAAPQVARPHATLPLQHTAARSFRTREKRARRIDLTIALAVSAVAHGAIALMPGEEKQMPRSAEAPPIAAEAITFDLPEPEETPVEVTDSEPAETPLAEFAPPMQADLPSIVTVDSFVQPMQPPAPSGISTDVAMLVVPPTAPIGQGGAAPKLFDIAELDRVPNRIRTGPLNYPREFLRSRTEGDVVLLVIIDPNGRVRVDRVLESTHPDFTRAAVTAAELSLYESPKKGGAAVSAQYTLRVPFRLAEGF